MYLVLQSLKSGNGLCFSCYEKAIKQFSWSINVLVLKATIGFSRGMNSVLHGKFMNYIKHHDKPLKGDESHWVFWCFDHKLRGFMAIKCDTLKAFFNTGSFPCIFTVVCHKKFLKIILIFTMNLPWIKSHNFHRFSVHSAGKRHCFWAPQNRNLSLSTGRVENVESRIWKWFKTKTRHRARQ